MKPNEYYKTLSKDQRSVYAAQAGTTGNYLAAHVFRDGSQMRRPSNALLVGLVNASEGQVSLDEAIEYFLVQPVRKLAAELGSPSQLQAMSVAGEGEMERFDTKDKRRVLRRGVGQAFEQMQVGL